MARRRSIAPTLGTRRSLRKQALIKRGTRVDSHLRATDIPPKTKKKTGDYPPPFTARKERERETRERSPMEEREKTKMTPDWFVICLSTPPSTRDVVFSPVYTKTTAFGGWGWSFSCRKIFERYSCKDPRQRCRTEPVPALFSYPNLNVIKLYISWHHHRP